MTGGASRDELEMSHPATNSFLPLARSAHRAGAINRAALLYQRVMAVDPSLAEAVHVLGGLEVDQELGERGLSWLRRSLRLESQNGIFWLNLAVGLQRFSLIEEALEALRSALSLQPLNSQVHLNLGHVFKDLKRHIESRYHYYKSIALNPGEYAAYDHVSLIDDTERDLDGCVRHIDRAVQLVGSKDPDLLYRQGIYYLLLGRFDPGWDLVEYRWSAKQILRDEKFTKPLQTCKPRFELGVKPGVLFLWAEQGIGDEIMFAGLIADIVPHVTKVILQVDTRLIGLFSRAFPDIRIIARPLVPAESEYDYHLPIGSLAQLFRRNRADFLRGGRPYLSPDSGRVSEVHKRLGSNECFRIGISWYSRNGDHRCVDLQSLSVCLNRPDVQIVSLQYGDFAREIKTLNASQGFEIVTDTGIDCKVDIEGLAALVSCCDLVISIGNATTHLAGALGVKTWMMLPRFPGWRWLNAGRESLWYRSMRVYRQPASGVWDDVLGELSRDLDNLLS